MFELKLNANKVNSLNNKLNDHFESQSVFRRDILTRLWSEWGTVCKDICQVINKLYVVIGN